MGDDHYCILNGGKPAFVEAFLWVDYEYFGDTRKQKLWVNMLNPVDSGYFDIDKGLPYVEIPLNDPKYEIINIDRIGEAAQLVPWNPAA